MSKASDSNTVELNAPSDWTDLYLTDTTKIHEDYLPQLNDKEVLDYEEIGEEGFKPIIVCSVKEQTGQYLKQLILDASKDLVAEKNKVAQLNKRITEILTFDPVKLSNEIDSTATTIQDTKALLKSNQALQSLVPQLEQIETHFKSLSKVARDYEEVYKNIILPVKEEGKSGVRQTIKWAIISIIASTLFSWIISFLMQSSN